MDALTTSPLDAAHRAAGAKMVPFGGWSMPLEFTGTIDEHLACRRACAVFDVSHLGTVRVEGDGARDVIQRTLTNDLSKIAAGRAQYTHLLDHDGSVLDDIIVWWYPGEPGHDVFDVMPNASNTERVLDALGGVDRTRERAVLAVQGPDAHATAAAVIPTAADVGRFRVVHTRWGQHDLTIAGTGYTGERGIEISVDAEHAPALWADLVDAGATPAGLGARDTLRLEAALPLHGSELGPGITPLQAGLGWVVAFDSEFRGRDALLAERERGVHRHLVGLTTEGRRPPRAGSTIVVGGENVGTVTSGNFSPVLQHGIALGFVPPAVTVGDQVEIDVRGRPMPARVVETPFVRR